MLASSPSLVPFASEFHGLRVEKVRFNELAEDFLNDYRANGRKSLGRAEISVSNLKGFFDWVRARDITTDRVTRYVMHRQGEGVKNATINRELAALKRILNLAARQTPPKVIALPHIPMLKESAPREGFFEPGDFRALRWALPDRLKVLATVAYFTGMRRGELLSLTWEQVNLAEKSITLRAGTTKNDRRRVVFMEGELLDAIEKQKRYRDTFAPSCPLVFFRLVKEGGRDAGGPD